MKKMKFRTFTKTETTGFSLFFLMTVGVLMTWVMVTNIIDTTIFLRMHLLNFVRVFFVVGIFGLIFRFEILTKIAFWLFCAATVLIVTGFMLFGLMPETTNILTESAEIFLRSGHFLFGLRPYTMLYEQVIIWTLILLFSFIVAFFGYAKFNFWVLIGVLATTASIAITSPYFMFYQVFYAFTFSLLTLIVINSQQMNQIRIGKVTKTKYLSELMMPLLAIAVGVAIIIPTPPETSDDGFFRSIVRAPFTFVNNLFSDLTTQAEFSLASVGFGGNTGRLGGDVALNDHVFMQVRTTPGISMPLYLTGATSNTYTGYSWLNRHTDYQPVNFNDFYQQIELLERFLSRELPWHVPMIDAFNSGRLVEEDSMWLLGDIDEDTRAWMEEWRRTYRFFMDETTGTSFQAHVPEYQSTWFAAMGDIRNMSRALLTINTLNNRTTSLFHSGIVREITHVASFGDQMELLRTRDGRIIADRRLERETVYRVYHNDLNRSYTLFGTPPSLWSRFTEHNPLQHSYHGVLSDLVTMLEDFRTTHGYYIRMPYFRGIPSGTMTYAEVLTNFLIPRSELIHEIYLQLPDSLPDRVRELAEEVTADATTNYERMVYLEAFLRENSDFIYTLTPGETPRDRDFVDHFLFDIRQGYCVHFATAFVVMARTLGMPTRYVEGFVIQSQRGWNDDINVLNNMAHAWAEVYFEGYGWVRFEPTPSGEESNAPGPDAPSGGIDLGNLSPEYDQDPEMPEIFPPTQNQTPSPIPGQDDNQLPTEVNGDTTAGSGETISPIIIILVGLVAVPITILARIGYVRHQKIRFSKMNNHEKVNYEYQKLLTYLQLLGYEINSNETEIAFMQRIRKDLKLSKHEQAVLVVAARIYTKGRYSKLETDDIEITVFAKINKRLDAKVAGEIGKIRYYIYQNIIGKF